MLHAYRLRLAISFALIPFAAALSACGGRSVATDILVSPATLAVARDENRQLTAKATFSDGEIKDVTTQVTWTSSDPSIAMVQSKTGVVTALKKGTVKISARAQGNISSSTITVTDTLRSIQISAIAASVQAGRTLDFKAFGGYPDGSTLDITSQVTWTSSNATLASPSILFPGRITGIAVGSNIQITATDSSTQLSASTTISVTAAPVTLTSIQVTASASSVEVGSTLQYTATGFYSNGTSLNITNSVTWSSSNAGAAAMSTTVLGRVSGLVVGSGIQITATDTGTGVSGSAALSVTAPALTSITLELSGVLYAGGSYPMGTAPITLTATGHYSDGSSQDITGTVTWASGNSLVVGVSDGVVSFGLVGSTTVSATSGSVSAAANIDVTL